RRCTPARPPSRCPGRSRPHGRPPRARRPAPGSAPAPSRLRPFREVPHRAERVGYAVLAAVADEHDMDVAEPLAALRAGRQRILDVARLAECSGLPVSSLDRPRHHVLEPAEHRVALPRLLLQAEALLAVDRVAAPGAA